MSHCQEAIIFKWWISYALLLQSMFSSAFSELAPKDFESGYVEQTSRIFLQFIFILVSNVNSIDTGVIHANLSP